MKKFKKYIPFIISFIIFSYILTCLFGNNNVKSKNVSNWEQLDKKATQMTFFEFEENLKNDNIDTVYAEFNQEDYAKTFYFTLKEDKTLYLTDSPLYEDFKYDILKKSIIIEEKSKAFSLTNINPKEKLNPSSMFTLVIDLFFIVFIVAMLRNVGNMGGNDKIYTITNNKNEEETKKGIIEETKTTTKDKDDEKDDLTFETVGGLKEVKKDLVSVVDFIKNPKKYHDRDAKLPRGVMLVGPPGTGKTLLAKTIAKETKLPFIYANGSDFVEMYVGRGAARIRSLFKEARNQAPCIVFIDEIDSLCAKRNSHDSHGEDRKTLTALLAEMDGFKDSSNVLIIGATNRLKDIDNAALRPGRFTEIFHVPIPETTEERMEVINIYAKNKHFSEDVDLKDFCREMIGRSPAEIEAVLNEAAIISVQKDIAYINKDCIEEAFCKRIMQGHQKDNKETNPVDLKTIAYHEAGHALLAKLHGREVIKVTIAPSTSGAGGYTLPLPPDRKLYSKKMLKEKVMELYGGKVAEYLLYDKNWDLTTGGCSNDIEQASQILQNMVESYGMSENGLVCLNVLTNEVASEISKEFICNMSKELLEETICEMEKYRNKLDEIADALLEHETIYEVTLDEILKDVI